MLLTADMVIRAASLLSAFGVLAGGIGAVCKLVERDRRQSEKIRAIQSEQTLICYALLACLKGLKEQGCNGPVTEAIHRVEKHLNQKAYEDL